MASRRNPHQMDAAAILAEADRTTRKASTSSERARRQMAENREEIKSATNVVRTYEEAEAAIAAAAEEQLELERQIEEEEKRLAEAEAAAAEEAAQIRQNLEKKKADLIAVHRRIAEYNQELHSRDWR